MTPSGVAIPPAGRPAPRGFTLLELMMVVTILATVLLLVPPNLHMFGARSRLENAANTLLALVAAAREQAIMDGQPVRLELGLYKDKDGETRQGHRLVLSSNPVQMSAELDEDADRDLDAERDDDEEWVETVWHDLPGGVEYAGVSEERENWQDIVLDRQYAVLFGPDGSVEKGFAIRLESKDLEESGVEEENRTITIVVNPLTAEATSVEGVHEMPIQREMNDFPR